ncbi:hypothetical protein, partial [Bacillus sp. 7884-1]|uniref:hypothetical protein n=1 Tax=Bacillus sp. 7884-1 TaxID=2021693 RepID=UPI001C528D8E
DGLAYDLGKSDLSFSIEPMAPGARQLNTEHPFFILYTHLKRIYVRIQWKFFDRFLGYGYFSGGENGIMVSEVHVHGEKIDNQNDKKLL